MLKQKNFRTRLLVSTIILAFAAACSSGTKPKSQASQNNSEWARTNANANPADIFERYNLDSHEKFHGRRSVAQAASGIGYPADCRISINATTRFPSMRPLCVAAFGASATEITSRPSPRQVS